jgi:hypothetical protein
MIFFDVDVLAILRTPVFTTLLKAKNPAIILSVNVHSIVSGAPVLLTATTDQFMRISGS